MSALHTSASDRRDTEMRAARAAGWGRSELWWERLQERANAAWEAGDAARAARRFRLAWWLARAALPRADPRRATSLANAALAARQAGADRLAARRYAAALRLWADVPSALDRLELRGRARSSLFHLRLEARHRAAFEANRRTRLARFVVESGETLAAAAAGRPAPHRHFARWRGEKPAAFDDARRLLAACLLLATHDALGAGPGKTVSKVAIWLK